MLRSDFIDGGVTVATAKADDFVTMETARIMALLQVGLIAWEDEGDWKEKRETKLSEFVSWKCNCRKANGSIVRNASKSGVALRVALQWLVMGRVWRQAFEVDDLWMDSEVGREQAAALVMPWDDYREAVEKAHANGDLYTGSAIVFHPQACHSVLESIRDRLQSPTYLEYYLAILQGKHSARRWRKFEEAVADALGQTTSNKRKEKDSQGKASRKKPRQTETVVEDEDVAVATGAVEQKSFDPEEEEDSTVIVDVNEEADDENPSDFQVHIRNGMKYLSVLISRRRASLGIS
eukprot:scaffold2848_cov218-Pinguiococcus_pyrenoidosus.AAC.1